MLRPAAEAQTSIAMIHPHTRIQYIDDHKGYGVFATAFIPRGTVTYVKDSLELEVSPKDYALHSADMQAAIEKYSYIDERGYRIVSWDFAKYVNHCCDCNTMSTGYGFEIAIRDIQPGEEITDEYGIFNLEQGMEVACSSPLCRRRVAPEDFDHYFTEWDIKLKQALPGFWQVGQPLKTLLSEEVLQQLEAFRQNPGEYRSVYLLKAEKARLNGQAIHQ